MGLAKGERDYEGLVPSYINFKRDTTDEVKGVFGIDLLSPTGLRTGHQTVVF